FAWWNPSFFCWKLTELRVLSIVNNAFSGEIPSEIGMLRHLEVIELQGNNFSGKIPNEISNLTSYSLRLLNLSCNLLTGKIPSSLIGSGKLRVVDLSDNQLSGKINVVDDCLFFTHLKLSNNFLVGSIPAEIGKCLNLRTLLVDGNILEGSIPSKIGLLSELRLAVVVLTNLVEYSDDRSLDIFRGEYNAFVGGVPEEVVMIPALQVLWAPRANIGGRLVGHWNELCSLRVLNLGQNYIEGVNLKGNNLYFLDEEDIQIVHFSFDIWDSQLNGQQDAKSGDSLAIRHDFGWNNFTGSLPLFSLSDVLFIHDDNVSYGLSLNDNGFNGSVPSKLLSGCGRFHRVSVNLTANQISGEVYPTLLQDCLELTSFEAAQNQMLGSLSPGISNLLMLGHLDLRENHFSGSLPKQLGDLKPLKILRLGGNNFTGGIPPHLGQLTSLEELDLSKNNLRGPIPSELANATSLRILVLDHNELTDDIPLFLHSCPDPYSVPPAGLPVPLEVEKSHSRRKMKTLIIATATSVSVVIGVLLVILLGLTLGKKKLGRLTCLRRKVVVTFTNTPVELTYDNVVSATGNFSIRNLIGTGGFGSTYKAELVPGYLVAVKRLSIGRFQGIQQFEAEIKTLGRVRHKNLVTLIGYYVGDTEMFLIYNYLSGGNLETFIHERSAKNVKWPEIYKITADVAHALAYLHYSCVPRIVHRDIKPSNILLDEELNAYLSDFGLARLLEVSQTHATTDVAGTFGYVAPEYATTCRVSDKADVYSFGVVLLELMSGKKTLDPSFSEYGNGFNIVGWAMLLMDEDRCSEFFYSELWESGPEENLLKMLQLALSCTVESLAIRPSMKQVLEKLKHLSS
ncbi:LRR receptor-like serine/threonine-protein kinase RPK2, partial [Bienertia sinuspersici]